jgi:3-mercaptopyruvate sulfurtransferase SseA
MKRIMYINFMFFLFLSFVAQVQAESQNEARVRNQIVTEARKGGYQLITPEELKKEYLTDSAAFLLVDTRQDWAYQMQHIEGASHIDFTPTWWNQYSPMTRSEMKILLGPDKNKKVIFY